MVGRDDYGIVIGADYNSVTAGVETTDKNRKDFGGRADRAAGKFCTGGGECDHLVFGKFANFVWHGGIILKRKWFGKGKMRFLKSFFWRPEALASSRHFALNVGIVSLEEASEAFRFRKVPEEEEGLGVLKSADGFDHGDFDGVDLAVGNFQVGGGAGFS